MKRPPALVAITALLALPGVAAPAKKRPSPAPTRRATSKPPAANAKIAQLTSISVLPERIVLKGPRSEQGLIVTGQYADGSLRDLTGASTCAVSDPKVAAVQTYASRRVIRPLADGATTATVRVAGAATVSVPIETTATRLPQPVSFRAEVIPALTKAGCSAGTCHGTPTGKGGFRLSLQGYAPEMDYVTIAREGGGRRVNPADPGRSLLLLKPMAEVPHGGGKRLSAEMPEFQVLSRWITEGAHDDPSSAPTLTRVEVLPGRRTLLLPGAAKQQIAAVAHFSDGSVRDVTSLAKLSTSDEDSTTVSREGLVEGTKRGDVAVLVRYQDALQSLRLTYLQNVPGFRWSDPPEQNFIDRCVFDRLKLFQIPASDLAGDTEFLRRAYLDTLGILPTPDEVRSFLKECAAERQSGGSVEARKDGRDGSTPTLPHSHTSTLPPAEHPAPKARAALIDRLLQRPEFADFWALKWSDVLRIKEDTLGQEGVRAYHRWVRESILQNKPVDKMVRELLTARGGTLSNPAANYYRAIEGPDQLAEATAQLFLGVRMGCAKCHNHPYERWTQDEYYELAAFFAQVHSGGGGRRRDEQTIGLDSSGEVRHPRTDRVMRPKLLGAAFAEVKPGEDRRAALAEWLTGKENPFFAKSIVNRAWANLLGGGLVEPIDDFRDSNPSVNDALLDALAKDFVAHGFDFRHLVRTIMSSRTYQLTARGLPLNEADTKYYSHALTQHLTAEQISDAISEFTGIPEEIPGYPRGTRAAQVAGTASRTTMMKVFGRPDRNLSCECEREKDPTLFQALKLITDRDLQSRLRADGGRIAGLAASAKTNEQVVEEMYLASLSRSPSAREKADVVAYVTQSKDRRAALEDLGWALINSKEFQFRH